MMTTGRLENPSRAAVNKKGWLTASKWLLARRASQLSIIGLFLIGPWFGIWIVTGNLNSSLTLDILPLTDPYVLLQTLFTGHIPETQAITGVLIVITFYLLVGGRSYCAWVCPVNMITDAAMWLRNRLKIKSSIILSRQTRYWILLMTLLAAGMSGALVWEFVNPVSMISRALIFGMGFAWALIVMIFLFDTLISRRAWCGYLCPVGAFYSLLGKFALIRVNAVALEKCDDCMDCYRVCPEHQVITPVLKRSARETSLIMDVNCTNCGRCIDVCSTDVFRFDHRFNDVEINSRTSRESNNQTHHREVLP